MEKKISVIMPTMWKVNQYMFPMLKILQDSPNIGEVILIDNNKEQCPKENLMKMCSKIVYFPSEQNLYYNLSMNFGVTKASYDLILLLNDDVIFDPKIFEYIVNNLTEEMGIIAPLSDYFNRGNENPILIKNLNLQPLVVKDGMGCSMFMHKNNYVKIPEELKMHFGDDFLFKMQTKNNRKNYNLHNWVVMTPMRGTTNAVPALREVIQNDWKIVRDIFPKYGLPSPISEHDRPIIGGSVA